MAIPTKEKTAKQIADELRAHARDLLGVAKDLDPSTSAVRKELQAMSRASGAYRGDR